MTRVWSVSDRFHEILLIVYHILQEIIGELVKMELLEWVVVLKKHLDHVPVNILIFM